MKIEKIEAIPYSIPYHHVMSFATGELTHANHVLIKVHTSEGVTGIGEAVSRPMIYGESQSSIVAAVNNWFSPALIGLDPFAVELAQQRMSNIVANNTTKGAIDIALHDIRGKVMGQPCWRIFGGMGEALKVTGMLSLGDPDTVAAQALELKKKNGISVFKIKVGLDMDVDLAVVAAVRHAVGDEAELYVDANHGFSAECASIVLPKMNEYGITMVEEPNLSDDFLGRKRLAQRLDIPIMADESATNLADATREVFNGAARVLSIKTTRTGFTESGKIVSMAQALGTRALLGNQADSVVGTSASLNFGAGYPWVGREAGELDLFNLLTDQVTQQQLKVQKGMLDAPKGSGIGVDIDDEKLAHYRVDRD